MHIRKSRRAVTAAWAASAAAAAAVVGPAAAGSAQQTPPPTTTPPPPVARPPAGEAPAAFDAAPELMIAGRTVMRLRARAGGLTPAERAYNLRQRLGPILTLPILTAEDVTIGQRRAGQSASIFVRGRLLVTVDTNLARANNTSVEGLAAQWARNLQQTLPLVNVTVRMSGSAPVTSPPPGAAAARTGTPAGGGPP